MRGLYVHIPFCGVKCYYCDFVAVSGHGHWSQRYLNALAGEMAAYRHLPVDSVYVGGGTPSELSTEQIEELFRAVENLWGSLRGSGREATFEANPESLNAAKLQALLHCGVNRLSLGLEAVQDSLLKSLGRRHDFDRFLEVFHLAREAGFGNLNVDLMFALPGQTLDHWSESLERVLDLMPQHISLYGLFVEDQTVLRKRGVVVDEDFGSEMYPLAIGRLQAAGYHHYEISNFSLPGFEAVHNRNYWRNGEYIGVGCGAVSFLGGARQGRVATLKSYCEAVEKGLSPIHWQESLNGQKRMGEDIFLGLRQMDGFKLPPEAYRAFEPQWVKLKSLGLVQLEGLEGESALAKLTSKGTMLANQVFQEFI
ncbi:MAG: radical SAM family heme chaperone HemW [Elusimicrobia bacterium]|nr:radical SAM family heme chaperone HemW [Elusimicrobiota bacterium]